MDRNLNALWLRCILEEVLACGVQDAVICAGGRSIALSLAIRENPAFRHILVHTDERSACFMAMGIARSTNRPTLVVTTSGSAVTNLTPGLAEAHALRIPLILLTCDRPRSLRNTGYGQMLDHMGACRTFVAAGLDLPDPQADSNMLIAVRERVNTAVSYAINPDVRGVVHINIPLEGNYDSTEVAKGWRMPQLSALASNGRRDETGKFCPMQSFQFARSDHIAIGEICRRLQLRPGLRGLIVAGPECSLPNDEVNRFSKAVGFPVLADTASGLRCPAVDNLVTGYDALIGMPGLPSDPPQLIIRLGLEPTLAIVHEYLLAHPCPTIKITAHPVARDYLHPEFLSLVRPDSTDIDTLAMALAPGDATWLARWKSLNARTRNARHQIITALPWGEIRAANIVCNASQFDFIHYANSMSIRSGDMFSEPSQKVRRVFSNRGVNGIDGTLGTFLGELVGTQQSGLLLIGDLAFIHDLPALACRTRESVNGCICVMNNSGGAIFDFLAASQLPGYQDTVRNTAEIDIEAAAACFRLPYGLAENEEQLRTALQRAANEGGLHLIEVRVPQRSGIDDHFKLRQGVHAALANRMPLPQ